MQIKLRDMQSTHQHVAAFSGQLERTTKAHSDDDEDPEQRAGQRFDEGARGLHQGDRHASGSTRGAQ